jgi:hypothetical protein
LGGSWRDPGAAVGVESQSEPVSSVAPKAQMLPEPSRSVEALAETLGRSESQLAAEERPACKGQAAQQWLDSQTVEGRLGVSHVGLPQDGLDSVGF